MITLDVRIIFDNEDKTFVIGCHHCEKFKSVDISNIEECAKLTPEFVMEHIQTCGIQK